MIFTHTGIAIGPNTYNIMTSLWASYDNVGLALTNDAMTVKMINSIPNAQNIFLRFLYCEKKSKVEAPTPTIEVTPENTTPYLVL